MKPTFADLARASLGILVLLASVFPSPADAAHRTGSRKPPGTQIPSALTTNYVTDAKALVQCLLGSQVTVMNETLSDTLVAAGTFSGGTGIIGFESGIVLSTG